MPREVWLAAGLFSACCGVIYTLINTAQPSPYMVGCAYHFSLWATYLCYLSFCRTKCFTYLRLSATVRMIFPTGTQ